MQDLTPQATEALDVFESEVSPPQDGLSKERAIRVLVDSGFSPQAAERQIETLHNNGRIYDVNEVLYLTEPPE